MASAGAYVPGYGAPKPAQVGPSAAQQQQWAQADAAQKAANAQYDAGQQQLQRSRASDMSYMLMQNPNNPRTTDGTNYEISNGGGGGGSSSGSRGSGGGGVAIGGSIYPDITALKAQAEQMVGPQAALQRTGAPQVPTGTSGFAHAKDVAGRAGNKALEALRNNMTARGISDSGMATMGEANILGQVARQGSDAEYAHQAQNTARQWQANQMAYQGDLSQNATEYGGAQRHQTQTLQALMALMSKLY